MGDCQLGVEILFLIHNLHYPSDEKLYSRHYPYQNFLENISNQKINTFATIGPTECYDLSKYLREIMESECEEYLHVAITWKFILHFKNNVEMLC